MLHFYDRCNYYYFRSIVHDLFANNLQSCNPSYKLLVCYIKAQTTTKQQSFFNSIFQQSMMTITQFPAIRINYSINVFIDAIQITVMAGTADRHIMTVQVLSNYCLNLDGQMYQSKVISHCHCYLASYHPLSVVDIFLLIAISLV